MDPKAGRDRSCKVRNTVICTTSISGKSKQTWESLTSRQRSLRIQRSSAEQFPLDRTGPTAESHGNTLQVQRTKDRHYH